MLAVRRVTQDNQGKKPGVVDGVKKLSPVQRLAMVKKLVLKGKSKPTRRVWIDKPGTDEKRPLGIPTMYDRAIQALVKLALEPEWEARFEPNSYGFRPGRSCQDAVEAIFNAIRYKAKYVLDADIAEESVLEVDQIIPKSKGGKNEFNNIQLLHRHCHDEKTVNDGSSGNKSGCNSAKPKPVKRVIRGTHDKWSLITEEPCEVKISSRVLETSGSREGIA